LTTHTSLDERAATATGSIPTGTAPVCTSPPLVTSKISSRSSGVLTANSRVPFGVPALLAAVAPQQLGSARIANPLGDAIIESLARSLHAKEEPHGVDVETLDGTERGNRRVEIRGLSHGRHLWRIGPRDGSDQSSHRP
jgi:hypothetical protein